MKATLDPAALAKALGRLKPAVMRNPQPPVLSGVRLDPMETGVLRLEACDLDTRIRTRVDAQVGVVPDPAIVVPHERLAALVARCRDTVTLDSDGDVLNITSGRVKATLRLLDANEWPRTPEVDGEPVKWGEDWGAIRSVAYARSHDTSRPLIGLIEVAHGTATATDSYRLASVAGIDTSLDVLLPGRLVDAVDGDDLELTVGERWLELRNDDTAWAAVRPEGTFPTWRSMLPTDTPLSITVDRQALIDTLGDVAAIGLDEKATKVGGVLARFAAGGACVVVSATHAELGEVEVELPAEVEGVVPEVWFNAGLLREALEHAQGDTVTMRGVDALKPWLIVDGDTTALLMPVRR